MTHFWRVSSLQELIVLQCQDIIRPGSCTLFTGLPQYNILDYPSYNILDQHTTIYWNKTLQYSGLPHYNILSYQTTIYSPLTLHYTGLTRYNALGYHTAIYYNILGNPTII